VSGLSSGDRVVPDSEGVNFRLYLQTPLS
jgi:hypothetical protein